MVASDRDVKCKRERRNKCGRGKTTKKARETNGQTTACKDNPARVFFWRRRGVELAELLPSLKTWRPKSRIAYIVCVRFSSQVFKSLRHLKALIQISLSTIHPNPGPRDKSERGKEKRRERRYKRRKEKREAKNPQTQENSLRIATWNVQRMSLGTRNRRKLKAVATYAAQNNWDAILLSETLSDSQGQVWLGEGESLTTVIYTKKAAILLRGQLLKSWCDGGQTVHREERSIAAKIGNLVLISTYLPVFRGANTLEIENTKEEVKRLSEWASSQNVLIIGGDFNAHVGGGEERPGVCGKFGLRMSNEQGKSLLDWCEENNLVHVNSFFNNRRRGTWFHRVLRRWYELDGFIMRDRQRHRYVRKVHTVGEASLSDHKPKLMRIELDKKLPKKKREKKPPRIKWEKLRNAEIKINYRTKVAEILEERRETHEDPDRMILEEEQEKLTRWNDIAEVVTKAAVEVCGTAERKIENEWMIEKEEEVTLMRQRITNAIETKNNILETMEADEDPIENIALQEAIAELKEARRILQRESRRWEREWWQKIIDECEEASERNDHATVYRLLKQLGQRGKTKAPNTTTLTKEDFKNQFQQVSQNRFENDPEDIEEVLRQVEDISETEKAREWRNFLDEIPEKREILDQMRMMKDSAPGKDGVRLIYIEEAGEEIINLTVKLVQDMYRYSADRWENSLKVGQMVALHKKGNINIPNNYRGVCLLAMGSRILARVIANRLRFWAEDMDLLDDEQAGFRKGRSTADVTQVMVRIQEDVKDLKKRMAAVGEELEEDDKPMARLLDLRKAYPRVNKHVMWTILRKYGMGPRCLRVVQDLHETTEYCVKTREGESEPWKPERGLREGCPSSPILFNIHHQVVMRIATKKRKQRAEEMQLDMGLAFKWIPGSFFPNEARKESNTNSEAKRIKVDKGLFADDTTKVGKKKELDQGIQVTKDVMNSLEERNNDEKEEILMFGEEEGDQIRMLGSYIGEREDTSQRIRRAGMAWSKVKPRLKGSKMSKVLQARIVQACVESTMLFDCQVRTWHQKELKRMQSTVDKMYRYIWSNKTKPPLIQMQEDGVNMQDIRNSLKINSVRWKVEKRVLERVGHIFRMEDNRQVKAVVLGWLEDLESYNKCPGKKRKTLLYWKRLLKEAGFDYTKIGQLTEDRKAWKSLVKERMNHLKEWERRGGKRVEEERGNRNTAQTEESLTCDWEGCGKTFRSKAGLTIHIKRIHSISKQKVLFRCERCEEQFKQEANLKNHSKICTGLRAEDPTKRKCNICMREYAKSGFKKHYNRCVQNHQIQPQQQQQQQLAATVYVPEYADCPNCGLSRSKSNMSRHRRVCEA